MLHPTLRVVMLIAVAVIFTGCSGSPAGRAVGHVARETGRLVPYTANAAISTVKYAGSEVKRLGRWFCCAP